MPAYEYGTNGVHGATDQTGVFLENFNYAVTDQNYTRNNAQGDIVGATHFAQSGTFSFDGPLVLNDTSAVVSQVVNLANAAPYMFPVPQGESPAVTAVVNNAALSGTNTSAQSRSVSGMLYPFAPPTPAPASAPAGGEPVAEPTAMDGANGVEVEDYAG